MIDAQTALAQVREALAAGPTPGPWSIIDDHRGDTWVTCEDRINEGFVEICMVERGFDEPFESEQITNANFIAACSPANIAAILAHIEAQAAENERLRKFVGRVLGEARQYMSDIDGGDVQAWAVECGLLEEWTATEPCGEQCECAEVADFPTRCYRLTETGKAAIDAAKEEQR